MVSNERYVISEQEYDGKIFSVGPKVAYRSGNGFFRTLVLKIRGMYPNSNAYVPITLFGLDAEQTGHETVGKIARITARLVSRQYEDRNGEFKWAVSLSASKVEVVTPAPEPYPEQEPGNPTVMADDPNSDIPF